jgi:hypothetical protein
MEIESIPLKATPNAFHFDEAKKIVISQFECFKGSIWNLTDFNFDDLPLGVHLAETLLQQFKTAEFEQNLDTVSYAVGLIARYLWWKDYLSTNPVKYVIASHSCYEFALPQLAGMKLGIDSYFWHDNYLFYSNKVLPLPLGNHAWLESLEEAWKALSLQEKARYIDLANAELELRVSGSRVGTLQNDPRFIREVVEVDTTAISSETNNPVIVLYCHAFSDAPCVLPQREFRNLCSPLVSTRRLLDLLKDMPVDVFVKTHPAPFPQDDIALTAMVSEYSNVSRLPNHLTPADLKKMGVNAVISGWGSVCLEGPFIGLQVLTYSDFSLLSDIETQPKLDLDDRESFTRTLNTVLNRKTNDVQREKIAEIYAISNFGSSHDLTCSKLAELPREGLEGRYAPFAYKYWAESFNSEDFEKTVAALEKFIENKECIFSRFSVRG